MGIIEGIILGAVQGISEFLPISSSGHLALFGDALLPDGVSMDLFTAVFLHLGTLGAVLIVFAREIFSVFLSPFTAIREYRKGGPAAALAHAPFRLFCLVALASIPVAAAGLLFESEVEALTATPSLVAILLGCTGVILLASEYCIQKRVRRLTGKDAALHNAPNADDQNTGDQKTTPTLRDALIIGLAQAAAILPGLSRSGLTISAARLTGMRRENAGVFSFLLFIPAVAGATLLHALELIKELHYDGLYYVPATPVLYSPIPISFVPEYHIAGLVSAFVFGLLALIFLVRLLKKGRFHYFGWYCLAAAIFWSL
jgi:undecaprenyl-diphosphatase